MRHPYQTPFADRNNLNIMLNLRLNGYSIRTLSLLFHCDKDSIEHHTIRYGIEPMTDTIFSLTSLLRSLLLITPQELNRWHYIRGEKINRGKTYAEYLADAKNRPPRK